MRVHQQGLVLKRKSSRIMINVAYFHVISKANKCLASSSLIWDDCHQKNIICSFSNLLVFFFFFFDICKELWKFSCRVIPEKCEEFELHKLDLEKPRAFPRKNKQKSRSFFFQQVFFSDFCLQFSFDFCSYPTLDNYREVTFAVLTQANVFKLNPIIIFKDSEEGRLRF